MDPIVSQIDTGSEEFTTRRDEMLGLVEDLRTRLDKVRHERDPKSLAYIAKQGKLPIWTRIEKLLDRS